MTLHVGLGTFRPVKVDDVENHHMHSEFYVVEEDQAKLINDTKKQGGQRFSTGTTAAVPESKQMKTGSPPGQRLDRNLYLSGLSV